MSGFRNAEDLLAARQRVIDQHGPWTTPIDVGFGVSTCDPATDYTGGTRLRRVVQVTADVAGRPLDGVRILDLACLEGMISVALARRGADVLGIEAREGNVARACFARDALGLENLRFEKDDVRNLSVEKHGSWDIVLCLGILYHLPSPDVFDLAARVFEVAGKAAIFDTQVALPLAKRDLLGPPVERAHGGSTYRGRDYTEFDPRVELEDRLKSVWSTIDARPSFWPTRASLFNLLEGSGFSSVMEVRTPVWRGMPEDRVMLVAFKAPAVDRIPLEPFPEEGETPP